jgi:DnaJ-domain-containing protein 1
MPDHFSVLGEPRRPWLDPEAVKEKFHSLSAEVHPDRVHGASEAERRAANERYTALNAAYQCLREPRLRLAHLLELVRGSRPEVVQSVPADLMNLFFEVGQHLKSADAFLAENTKATSPLLKVQLFARGQEISERLAAARRSLAEREAVLGFELRQLDEDWLTGARSARRAAVLDRLEEVYRLLSYFSRWNAQLQERIVQLALA